MNYARYNIILTLIVFCFSVSYSQEETNRRDIRPSNTGYYTLPKSCIKGVFLSNEKYNSLHFMSFENNRIDSVTKTNLYLKKYTVSNNGNFIGLSLKNKNKYFPAVYNVSNKKFNQLHKGLDNPSPLFFIKNNKYAFYIKDTLIIVSDKRKKIKKLKDKIIFADMSESGKYFAYSTIDNKIKILNLISGEYTTIVEEGIIYSLTWAPDNKKLVYRNAGILYIYNITEKKTYEIGKGDSPVWSKDSKHIIYKRNIPIKMKFVNSDIFISDNTGSNTYRITKTKNTFEIFPVFTNILEEIVYLTYENRKIVKAQISTEKEKILSKKILFKLED